MLCVGTRRFVTVRIWLLQGPAKSIQRARLALADRIRRFVKSLCDLARSQSLGKGEMQNLAVRLGELRQGQPYSFPFLIRYDKSERIWGRTSVAGSIDDIQGQHNPAPLAPHFGDHVARDAVYECRQLGSIVQPPLLQRFDGADECLLCGLLRSFAVLKSL